jgi:hypothetical protein
VCVSKKSSYNNPYERAVYIWGIGEGVAHIKIARKKQKSSTTLLPEKTWSICTWLVALIPRNAKNYINVILCTTKFICFLFSIPASHNHPRFQILEYLAHQYMKIIIPSSCIIPSFVSPVLFDSLKNSRLIIWVLLQIVLCFCGQTK